MIKSIAINSEMESAHALSSATSMYMCVQSFVCIRNQRQKTLCHHLLGVTPLPSAHGGEFREGGVNSSPTHLGSYIQSQQVMFTGRKKTWRSHTLGFSLCEGSTGQGWFHLRPSLGNRELPDVISQQPLSLATENKLLPPWEYNLYVILPLRHLHFLLAVPFHPGGTQVLLLRTGKQCSPQASDPWDIWCCVSLFSGPTVTSLVKGNALDVLFETRTETLITWGRTLNGLGITCRARNKALGVLPMSARGLSHPFFLTHVVTVLLCLIFEFFNFFSLKGLKEQQEYHNQERRWCVSCEHNCTRA